MSEQQGSRVEVRKIRRLLRETAKLARQASLTGTLERGARTSVQHYNRSLEYLERLGEVPAGFFPPLAEDASFDEVGVAAWQLAGYLRDEPEGAEEEEDRPRPGRHGGFGSHNVIHLGVGMKDLADLKDLGQVIRESLPEWIRGAKSAGETPVGQIESLSDLESRLAEVGAKLQAAAEQLRRGDLTPEQRAELADQLAHLGQEQARLARRHAHLRAREEGM